MLAVLRAAARYSSAPRSGQVGRRAVAPEDPGATAGEGRGRASGLRGGGLAGRGAALLGLARRRPHLPDARGRADRGGAAHARRDGRAHPGAGRPGARPLAAPAVGARARRCASTSTCCAAWSPSGARRTRTTPTSLRSRSGSAGRSSPGACSALDAYVVWSSRVPPAARGQGWAGRDPSPRLAGLRNRRRRKSAPTYLASEIEAAAGRFRAMIEAGRSLVAEHTPTRVARGARGVAGSCPNSSTVRARSGTARPAAV